MNRLKLTMVICVSLISTAAFSQAEKIDLRHPPVANYYLKSKDKWRYAILKFDPKRDKNLFDENNKASRVSTSEINDIERLIKKQVSVYNKTGVQLIIKPEKYFKQFIAVINPKGEKEVWVNCLCQVFGDSWKEKIPLVSDGGSCYFRLKVNLTKETLYDFSTNGLA